MTFGIGGLHQTFLDKLNVLMLPTLQVTADIYYVCWNIHQ